MREFSLLLQQL